MAQDYKNQNYFKKCKIDVLNKYVAQTPTCPKLKMETAGGSAKHFQSKQQRHQNYIADIAVVSSSSTPNICHTPLQCPHLQIRENKHPLDHNN